MATYSDPALILPGAVGQTELDASSKKDVVGGVAALDASGFLLAKGAGILFPRTGSNDVHIYERTSGEEAYAFHRAGADDYTFFIKESNVWKRFQTESMKDVANGIAGLNASALLPEALMPGILNKYIISDNLHTAQDSELSTTSEIYVNKDYMGLNILYPTPSTVRISFDLKSNTGAALAYGRLYKDDAPIGVERSTLSTSYVTFSEDISFAEWEYIQLWMRTENGAQPAYARNFRLYGDEHAQTLAEAIVQGDVGVSDCLDVV